MQTQGHVETQHGKGDDTQHGGNHGAAPPHSLLAAAVATRLQCRQLGDSTGTTANNINHYTPPSFPIPSTSSFSTSTATTVATNTTAAKNFLTIEFTAATT